MLTLLKYNTKGGNMSENPSHVLSGLIKKRSELLGLIDYHNKEIKIINDDLQHINASIKIFDPEYDLRTVQAKKYHRPCKHFKRGERSKLVLEVLRDSEKPLTSNEVCDIIKQMKYIDDNIYATIHEALKEQQNKGVLDRAAIQDNVFGWVVPNEKSKQFKLL